MPDLQGTIEQQKIRRPRFLRKTVLQEGESNINFKMIDNDIAEAITSSEADHITPLMSKIYTRLILTPSNLREGEKVLRFTGDEDTNGQWSTAWAQLCRHLRVSGETASKALKWLHEQGIIGYFAGKNGVGIRIFLNRAAASINVRKNTVSQKNFTSQGTSPDSIRTSPTEPPFKSFKAKREDRDKDINPHTPLASANPQCETGQTRKMAEVNKTFRLHQNVTENGSQYLEELIFRLFREMEPKVRAAAVETAMNEHERTRQWLEKSGIPKAVRVAQRESFSVLRTYGLIEGDKRNSNVGSRAWDVGRRVETPQSRPANPLTEVEIQELAEVCVSLHAAQGKPIEATISELLSGGCWLLLPDAERIRSTAFELLGCDERAANEQAPIPLEFK